MTMIIANVSKMFETLTPWDCSNNAMTMGQNVGKITWQNAMTVAESAADWLVSDRAEALAGIVEWAHDTGAWEEEETSKWSDLECLALFVQNVASDLRDHLDSDNLTYEECAAKYESTDWEKESCYPTGMYHDSENGVMVDYYTGC